MKAKVFSPEQISQISGISSQFNIPIILVNPDSIGCDLSNVHTMTDHIKAPKGVKLSINSIDKVCVFYL